MRIRVVDPPSPWEAWIIVLGCLFAMAAIVVGMEYLRPYLDTKNREMLQRRQTIEDAARSEQTLDEGEGEQAVKAPIGPPQQ
jgi:hypothetical protein